MAALNKSGDAMPSRRQALRALALPGLLAAVLPWLAACGMRQAAVAPGYYRVRRGDTLMQISRRTGHSVEALRRWNRLSNANRIQVGQVLRVAPPSSANGTLTATVKPASPKPATPKPASPKPASPKPASPKPPAPRPTPAPVRIALVRPAQGRIVTTYNGSTSRGLTIANAAGTPVVAAAAGSVMYASNGLRAYGNLIIIQHDAHYLTIYAHNRKLLVQEGQKVAQGQRIAEMGSTGSQRTALYFELRRNGQAIDPAGAFK